MAKVIVKIEYMDEGRTFEMEADTCTLSVDQGLTERIDGVIKYFELTGYSTITVHAVKVVTNEIRAKMFQTLKEKP